MLTRQLYFCYNYKPITGKPLIVPTIAIEQESNDDLSVDKTIEDDQNQGRPIRLPDKMFEQTLDILAQTRTVNRNGYKDRNMQGKILKDSS